MNTDNDIVKLLRLHQFFKCDEHFCIPTGKMANNSQRILFFIPITTVAFSLLSLVCSVAYLLLLLNKSKKESQLKKKDITFDIKYCK